MHNTYLFHLPESETRSMIEQYALLKKSTKTRRCVSRGLASLKITERISPFAECLSRLFRQNNPIFLTMKSVFWKTFFPISIAHFGLHDVKMIG